ncbi:hypothetical protein BKA64DRAFT_707601 [Cadophora sp. MPI-SDFR-AT-0126]|nr:hypothetical protein BKA64DRAFT_707601 [Leotiomycetes sp. MPI-SDFR-AT-0126]
MYRPHRKEDTLLAVEHALHAFSLDDIAPGEINKFTTKTLASGTLQEDKLDTFTCFPRLPLELRLKIWRAIARLPRAVAMSQCYNSVPEWFDWQVPNIRKQFLLQKIKSRQPAVLQTCRESRAECLGFYHLVFGTTLKLQYCHPHGASRPVAFLHEPTVHFNTLSDTFYWTCPPISETDSRGDKSDEHGNVEQFSPIFWLRDFFEIHRSIEEVILVIARHRNAPSTRGDFEFVDLDDDEEEDPEVREMVDYDFGALFQCLRVRYKKQLLRKECARTRRLANTDDGLGEREEEIQNSAPPEPEKPFIMPKCKIMAITRGGVRL